MIEQFSFRRIELVSKIKPFDCGDPDLNEFFHKDSLDYLRQLLAVTYVFEDKKQTVAFFSVLNDRISGEKIAKRAYSGNSAKRSHTKNISEVTLP